MEAINSSMANPSGHTRPEVEGTVVWNLTQHLATPEQREAGVMDLPEELRSQLTELLTFDYLPDAEELQVRSGEILCLISTLPHQPGARFMIGGAPFFMEQLSAALRNSKLRPVFAFSRRESVERVLPDGSVQKTAVFRHLGFVEPEAPRQ